MNQKIFVAILVTAVVVGAGVWLYKDTQVSKVKSKAVVSMELLNDLGLAKTAAQKKEAISKAQTRYNAIDGAGMFSFSNSSAKLASEEPYSSGQNNIGGWEGVSFNCVFAFGGEMLICD